MGLFAIFRDHGALPHARAEGAADRAPESTSKRIALQPEPRSSSPISLQKKMIRPDRQMKPTNAFWQFLVSRAAALSRYFRNTFGSVLKTAWIRLRGDVLCISYRESDGLRLFLGMMSRATDYQEIGVESAIRLRDALRAFVNDAEQNTFSSGTGAEPEQIKIFFLTGNFVKLRRDISPNHGVRLFIEFSNEYRPLREVPLASAAAIAQELDGFLSLQRSPAMGRRS